MSRFERDYQLIVRTPSIEVIVEPPFRVSFDALKSIDGFAQNKLTIDVYNLAERKRLAMVKDAEDAVRIQVLLYVGYKSGRELVFSGELQRGSNRREGADLVTQLYCLGVTSDFINKLINKSTKADPVNAVIAEVEGLRRGKITDMQPLVRPRVLSGTAAQLLLSLAGDNQFFVDNGALNIIKNDEVVSSFVPQVSAKTGLINTPEREQKRVTFETLMNPAIKIGGLIELNSKTAPHLNGIYKIQTIGYTGDNYGDAWNMTCTGYLVPSYRVI